jgi:hypothetical protein
MHLSGRCQILSKLHIIRQGGDSMETYFGIRSQTYADKAQHLLNRYRYPYRVTRVTGEEGCVYRFRVAAAQQDILDLLDAYGIPYQPPS